jgi:hypothetical protein
MSNETIQRLHDLFAQQSQRWAEKHQQFTMPQFVGYCEGRSQAYAEAAQTLSDFAAINGFKLQPYIPEENIIS